MYWMDWVEPLEPIIFTALTIITLLVIVRFFLLWFAEWNAYEPGEED